MPGRTTSCAQGTRPLTAHHDVMQPGLDALRARMLASRPGRRHERWL